MDRKKFVIGLAIGSIIGLKTMSRLRKRSIKKNGSLACPRLGQKVRCVLQDIKNWDNLSSERPDGPAMFKAKASVGGIQGSGTIICIFF